MAQVDEKIFGRVVKINGSRSIEKVAEDIRKRFDPIYQTWVDRD